MVFNKKKKGVLLITSSKWGDKRKGEDIATCVCMCVYVQIKHDIDIHMRFVINRWLQYSPITFLQQKVKKGLIL